MPPKECPPGKILNPQTGRCVDENGKVGKAIKAAAVAGPAGPTPAAAPSKPTKTCPDGKIFNPKTGRCVDINGKIGKALAAAKPKTPPKAAPAPAKPTTPPKPASPVGSPTKLAKLVEAQMEAMKKMNIPLWKQLTKQIEEEKAAIKAKANKNVPQWLEVCRNPVTKDLPKIHTIEGEMELVDVIKEEKQILMIDGLCYDIKSLFELIQSDIPQGNVFGVNPYVKSEGFVLPFAKDVKDRVLKEGIKRGLLPKSTKYIDHSPKSATDKEMRGTCTVTVKDTPPNWLYKGWASDGSAFPTKKYYALAFHFPNKTKKQNPGVTAIFPYNDEGKEFIYKKLIPAYDAGCIWSKKLSVSDGVEVINPNIHLVFEDNQPNRWYKNKIASLEEEILKYAPAFAS